MILDIDKDEQWPDYDARLHGPGSRRGDRVIEFSFPDADRILSALEAYAAAQDLIDWYLPEQDRYWDHSKCGFVHL